MILVIIVNSLIVSLCVAVHYESLAAMNARLPKIPIRARHRVVLGVIGAMVAHTIEIWIFAAGYYFLHHAESGGALEGAFNGSLLDCVYFSFTVFTTLGFGDIQPQGDLRYLTGIESLTGLVLITWSASFLYLLMQRSWAD